MRFFFFLLLVIGIIGTISNIEAEKQVPDWIKNTAGWWAENAISETEFVNAIEFLVNNRIIDVSTISDSKSNEGIPDWIKNTAGWWAENAISETEFVNAIEFLVKNGIINVNEKNDFKDTCKNELALQFDEKSIKKLCTPFYNLEYEEYQIFPKNGQNVIDNHGFRCNVTYTDYVENKELCKYPKEKPPDVYRIFLIGGSTIFSSNNDNAHTASAFLQEKISLDIKNKNIQVINAGISAAESNQLVKLVKDKIIEFEPDLIVAYDGWNDLMKGIPAKKWSENWKEICELGNKEKFETIIFLQPLLGTGYKTFFDYEYDIIRKNSKTGDLPEFEQYQIYHTELEKLNQSCYGAYDLTNMFDKIPTQIFSDNGHVGSKGDKILADNIFKFILPLLDETQSRIEHSPIIPVVDMTKIVFQLNESEYSLDDLNFENVNLSNLHLENQSVKNSIFYKSTLKNINFKNADLSNVIFTGANLDNVDFSDANLSNTVFFKTKLNDVIFSDANFDNASFVKTDFSNSIFNLNSLQKMELIDSIIPLTVTKFDYSDNQQSTYKPIENRETFVEVSAINDDIIIDISGTEIRTGAIFLPVSYLVLENISTSELQYTKFDMAPVTYKLLICKIIQLEGNGSEELYQSCVRSEKSLFQPIHGIDLDDTPLEITNIHQQIMNENKKTAVVFPTITLHAYTDECIWDYYELLSDDCQTIQLADSIDSNNLSTNIWKMNFMQSLDPHFLFNTSFYSFQILQYLNYEMLSDLEIERTPDILEKYDKIIVLHNKYVTENIFNAITNHPKVIYLHPGSLSEEVEIDFDKNLITVLSPIKYPEEKNYRNDFLWEYDNTHRAFELCDLISDPKFEMVSNGIMINCFPEGMISSYVELLKIIKDY